MLKKRIFDLARTDTVARRSNNVIVTAHEMNITLAIHHAGIARQQPIAGKLRSGCLGIIPITQKHHWIWTMDRNIARSAWRGQLACSVDNGNAGAWHRATYRAGPSRHEVSA